MYDPLNPLRGNLDGTFAALKRCETEIINYHLGRGSINQAWEYAMQAQEHLRNLDSSFATLPGIYRHPNA